VLVFASAAWGQDTPPDDTKPPKPPAGEETPAPPGDEEKPAEEKPAPAPVILPSASFDAWIPLKPDKVSEQLKLVQAELEAGAEAERKKTLEYEAAVFTGALQAFGLEKALDNDLDLLFDREEALEADAEKAEAEVQKPIVVPVPFKKDYLDGSLDRERRLQELIEQLDEQITTLEKAPDDLRNKTKKLDEEREALAEERKVLAKKVDETADDAEKERLKRASLVMLVDKEQKGLRRELFVDRIDYVRDDLKLKRLERRTAALRLEHVTQLVLAYQQAEADRLEQERLAAEAEAKRQAEELEARRAAGDAYYSLKGKEELWLSEQDLATKRESELSGQWDERHRLLKRDADLRKVTLEGALTNLQDEAQDGTRAQLRFERLNGLVLDARFFLDKNINPAAAEASALRASVQGRLDSLRDARSNLENWYTEVFADARAAYEASGRKYPAEYSEQRWKDEEHPAWQKIKEARSEAIEGRIPVLDKLRALLVSVEELAVVGSERVEEFEAEVRKRTFWLRSKPIIDMDSIQPAFDRATAAWERLQNRFRDGSLTEKLLGLLLSLRGLLGLFGLGGAVALIVLGTRKLRAGVEPYLKSKLEPPIPYGTKLKRAAWRILEKTIVFLPWVLLAAVVSRVFSGWVPHLGEVLLWISVILLGQAVTAALFLVVLRPHDAAWRLVPFGTPVSLALYRLFQRLVLVTTVTLGAWTCVLLFGADLVPSLREAVWLLFQLAVTVVVLFTVLNPVLLHRLIGLVSPAFAQRLQRFLWPISLFVVGCSVGVFVLHALGYNNAASSVKGSLAEGIVIIVCGIALDRLLVRMALRRLDPHGDEEEGEAEATASLAAEDDGGHGGAPSSDDSTASAKPSKPTPQKQESSRLDPKRAAPVSGSNPSLLSRSSTLLQSFQSGPELSESWSRRQLLNNVVEAAVSTGVTLLVVYLIFVAFGIEPSTVQAVLDYPLLGGATAEIAQQLRVGDVLSALFTVALTFVIYRYFRAFVANYVLPRFGLSRGARFAVSTVAGYVIIGFGVMTALDQVKIDLGDFDWFLAAAGVGIGFGLQEILSNFVSGLIILFERPIEVGDIVTVQGVNGEIGRITIRATTVVTPDNRAIIVPNKEFITATVTNWSHGSPEVRLTIPVGVAYGSNVALVRQTLRKVARSYGRVLKKPTPSVAFVGFGASSLDFELTVWVDQPDPTYHRIVRTDLCCAIDAAFNRQGIEIPFNQMDIHVREGDSLKVDARASFADRDEAEESTEAEDPEREALRQRALLQREKKKAKKKGSGDAAEGDDNG
jgi:small-conductance mechanosensitive channel